MFLISYNIQLQLTPVIMNIKWLIHLFQLLATHNHHLSSLYIKQINNNKLQQSFQIQEGNKSKNDVPNKFLNLITIKLLLRFQNIVIILNIYTPTFFIKLKRFYKSFIKLWEFLLPWYQQITFKGEEQVHVLIINIILKK